jgi:hypothetical protein
MHRPFLAASPRRNESSKQLGVHLRRSAAFRALIVNVVILGANLPAFSRPLDTTPLPSHATAAPSNIVIGFVGGFVGHNNPHHGPVQLARQIRRTVPKDTYVRVFENRRRKQAYDDVVRLLDTNHDGVLSTEEKARARIILFGHSWGAVRGGLAGARLCGAKAFRFC